MDNANAQPFNPAPQASKKLSGIMDLFKKTWEVLQNNIWVFVKLMVLNLVVSFVAGLILAASFVPVIGGAAGFIASLNEESAIGASVSAASVLIGLLISAVVFVFLIIFSIWINASLMLAVKEKNPNINIKELLKMGWGKTRSFFWISILTCLAVLAGLVLLVIPGFIFAIWFSFSSYILIWEGKKGIDALKRSKQLVKGYWWPVFGRFLLFGIIFWIASLVLGLIPVVGPLAVAFVGTPFALIYVSLLYEDLKQIKG